MNEIWKSALPGYEVSNHGQVRRSATGRRTHIGRILRPVKLKIGYYAVAPVVNGKNKTTCIHELVAAAFIGERPHGYCVNHKDGNKTNNLVENLEYVTHAQNMAHAYETGLLVVGEDHYAAKLTEEDVKNLRGDRASGLSYSKLAKKYAICISHAWQIAHGNAWRHVT